MRTVEIENIGPIEKLTIPLPDSGVIVLHGRNGVGKSHALAAVDSLISGRGRPPCRDGATKAIIEGFGAKLTIGRSTKRIGEAEVLTLEGRLDITQLVHPPIKDEEAADRTRIKALIQLSGQSADLLTFKDILPQGVDIDNLVSHLECSDDPVILAGQIKRALEAEARRHERAAEEIRAEIAVIQQEITVKDWKNDPLIIQACQQPEVMRSKAESRVAEALAKLRELDVRQEMAAQQAERITVARRNLAAIEEKDIATPEKIDAEIIDIDAKISTLEQALAAAKERRQQLIRRRDEARKLQEQIAELRQIVDQPIPIVSDADIAAAQDELAMARRQLDDTIQLIQQAKLVARFEQCRNRQFTAENLAELYRNAAHATDDVLSDLVSKVTTRLRVEEGRLVCDTDRGVEPFGELSPGERWRIALEIAAEQVGMGGLVTVPQEAWEALDPQHRTEVAQIAKEVGMVILTAEASDSDQIKIATIEPEVVYS